MAWQSKFKKTDIVDGHFAITTTLQWKGRWVRVEYMYKNHPDSSWPEMNFVQIRDIDTGKIIAPHCMTGFEVHTAFVWEDVFYLFATDYWGIYMSRSADLEWWSKPVLVLDNRSMCITDQNNSVCWDGKRFVMSVELLGGPYEFTICFAYSYNLQEFYYIPGAAYRFNIYTASHRLYYVDGFYYLTHLRNTDAQTGWPQRYLNKPADMTPEEAAAPNSESFGDEGNWWFEYYLSRSRNLLTWEDAPHNPILSPDPGNRISYVTGGTKPECSVADLFVYERNGVTIGDFDVGTQEGGTIPQFRHAEFHGTLPEFFRHFYEK